tara:strand:+ start:910 stop:1188 length:279 start_codon:yes stop_codon:yes gene_type:complete
MEKFLEIPVTGEQKQIVSILDVKLVEQASTTTVTLAYGSGKVVTITHAALSAGSEAMRDEVQNAIITALATGWTSVSYSYIPSSAVSGISIA